MEISVNEIISSTGNTRQNVGSFLSSCYSLVFPDSWLKVEDVFIISSEVCE